MDPNRARIAAVTAVAAGLIVLLVALVRSLGGGTYELTGIFDSANGLVPGAEVRVGGLKVGRISDIDLPPGGYPHVTMEIDDSYRARRGVSADVRLVSQAGQLNRYIDLRGGSGPPIEKGAVITRARTESPVEVDEALSFLTPKTRIEVRGLLRNVLRTLDHHGPDIDRTLAHSAQAFGETADLLTDVTADGAALSTLVRQGRRAMEALATEPAEIQGSADQLASLLDAAARRQADLSATLRLLPSGLRSPRLALERLDATVPALRRLVRFARPTVDELDPVSVQLRPTTALARPAVDQTLRLIDAVGPSMSAIEPVLRTATPVFGDLVPALRGINPALDQVRARAPDALGWVELFGDAAASFDAAGHAPSFFLTLGQAPNREIGPADGTLAGLLRRPFDRLPGSLESEPWTDYYRSFIGGGKPDEYYLRGGG